MLWLVFGSSNLYFYLVSSFIHFWLLDCHDIANFLIFFILINLTSGGCYWFTTFSECPNLNISPYPWIWRHKLYSINYRYIIKSFNIFIQLWFFFLALGQPYFTVSTLYSISWISWQLQQRSNRVDRHLTNWLLLKNYGTRRTVRLKILKSNAKKNL